MASVIFPKKLGCRMRFFNFSQIVQGIHNWAQFQWPSEWKNSFVLRNLTLLELIPVVLALYIWAPHLKTKKYSVQHRKYGFSKCVKKRTSKDKLVMKLLRPFVLLIMLNDIQFKAVHFSSSENSIADAISRFQLQRFRALGSQADMQRSRFLRNSWKSFRICCKKLFENAVAPNTYDTYQRCKSMFDRFRIEVG